MSGLSPDSSYKDRYIGRLETDLASARHQILILKARCAMLGDTGDNEFSPSRPRRRIASTPIDTTSGLEMESSGLVRSVRTRRKQDLGLRDRHPVIPPPLPKFETLQNVSRRSSSPRKRPLSITTAQPNPSPAKRAVLRATQSPVRLSKMPGVSHHRHCLDSITCRLPNLHLPYATRASQRRVVPTRRLPENPGSASRHQHHPASKLRRSPQAAIVKRSPGKLVYLRSRRHPTH